MLFVNHDTTRVRHLVTRDYTEKTDNKYSSFYSYSLNLGKSGAFSKLSQVIIFYLNKSTQELNNK